MSNDDPANWLGASDAPPVHDPHRAVRAQTRVALPKRFYAEADLADNEGGFRLTLDGRSANTPARNPLRLPTRALAEAVAAEWAAQVEFIDPSTMPLTRLANTAIDGVAPRRAAVIDDLSAYAGTDLVAYRAADPERLVADQARAWDPVIEWAHETYNVRLILSEGVMHVTQPETSVTALRGAIEAVEGPFRLAALHTMTTLTGSLLIALATLHGRLTPQESWAAAHVDEAYQASVWGSDAEAEARHVLRKAEFESAAELAKLAR